IRRLLSSFVSLTTGIPVQEETTAAISSSVTDKSSWPCSSFHLFFVVSSFSRNFCSCFLYDAAFSNSCLSTAVSFFFFIFFIFFFISFFFFVFVFLLFLFFFSFVFCCFEFFT